MLDALNDLIVRAMDYVLGWVLYLPRDVRLFTVAMMTSVVLTFVRLFATNQEWLWRAAADRKRLGQLIRQARREKDKQAKRRYKQTLLTVKLKALKFEPKPLAYAIIPVALLAMWCFARLGYEPVQAGQAVQLRMYLPESAIGRYPHLIPEEGIQAENGWVQEVVRDRPLEVTGLWDALNAKVSSLFGPARPLKGVAIWNLKAAENGRRYCLRIRHGGKTYEKELLVDSRRYAPPVAAYDSEEVTAVEVGMRPVRLFGVVGGVDFLRLPPWLVAYLLIAIPSMAIFKRVFRVY